MVETHRQRVLKKFGLPKDTSLSIPEIAKYSGIPAAALQMVYNRGIGAWKSNPESVRLKGSFKKDPTAPRSMKLGKEQWGMARVYSFVDRGKTFKTADADIAERFSIPG
jgi:hypothetical protein